MVDYWLFAMRIVARSSGNTLLSGEFGLVESINCSIV